jgi:hypothetical protein
MSDAIRRYRPEIRAVSGSNGRQFWAMPLAYEVVDDYGTIWTRGVFDRSVGEKMPILLYGHQWNDVSNVLGRGADYRDTDRGPEVLFELTDFDAHPHTRQVAAQINDGTLTDLSVGFDRWRWLGPDRGAEGPLPDEDRDRRGPTGARVQARERMLEAGWDETSVVPVGAVPGAKVLSGVRSRSTRAAGVAMEDVVALGTLVGAGKITHDEAQRALGLLGVEEVPDPVEEEEGPEPAAADVADAEAEADDTLDGLEG